MASDPRIFFAAERTLLAWVRTGIAIVGLGFLVAKFGLFLRIFAAERNEVLLLQRETIASELLGIAFVLIGAAAVLVATRQHARHIATLPEHDRPDAYSLRAAIRIALLVAIASLLLAVYLGFTLVAAV